MKILLCVFIVCGSSYIGFAVGGKYKRKVRLYEDLLLFCGKAKSDICYFQSRLYDMLSPENKNYGEEFDRLCLYARNSVMDGKNPIADSRAVSKICGFRDDGVVAEFFSSLGGSDGKNQKTRIEGYESVFTARLAAARGEMKSKGGLCGKLGIFAGLFVVILCI